MRCAASGPSCTFPVVVELPEDLSCTGDECTAEAGGGTGDLGEEGGFPWMFQARAVWGLSFLNPF